jgi:hypothetical protein
MENQMQLTASGRYDPDTYRTTARIVGVLFLAGMVVYVVGNGLVQSILDKPDHLAAVPAHNTLLAIGAILMLMAAAFDAAHGVLMLPVLKRHHEGLAFGYLGSRIIDAVLLTVGVVFLLLQIPLGREYVNAGASDASALRAVGTLSAEAHLYAYQLGMAAVGLAGFMLCLMFYRATLVPRPVATWGLVGYLILFGGSMLEVLGFDLRLIHTVPGGLWELFIGIWLIAKGFSSSPVPTERTPSSTAPLTTSPTAGNALA